jgi:FlaA1/EpsC-like NDP-sugar epimerase
MKKINIAILGVGRWGVHLLRNFLQHPQANVVAVVDPHFERLEWCKKQFLLLSNVVLSDYWSAVREMPEINAVAIATPASTHYNLIADALQQGYHVLAEKPLTVNPAEALELCHRNFSTGRANSLAIYKVANKQAKIRHKVITNSNSQTSLRSNKAFLRLCTAKITHCCFCWLVIGLGIAVYPANNSPSTDDKC